MCLTLKLLSSYTTLFVAKSQNDQIIITKSVVSKNELPHDRKLSFRPFLLTHFRGGKLHTEFVRFSRTFYSATINKLNLVSRSWDAASSPRGNVVDQVFFYLASDTFHQPSRHQAIATSRYCLSPHLLVLVHNKVTKIFVLGDYKKIFGGYDGALRLWRDDTNILTIGSRCCSKFIYTQRDKQIYLHRKKYATYKYGQGK